ncbi:MAG: hypothetical protein M1531_11645, partial [Chloroflexi bacterium]|nr:hypothetical protein [Chloroflexota bacterium]
MSVLSLVGLGLLAFAWAFLWAPWWIGFLVHRRVGKSIRAAGPSTHTGKAGTPTMGGWIMTGAIAAVSLLFLRQWEVAVPILVALLLFAVSGAIDDLAGLGSQEGLGLRVRYKFLWHNLIALGVAYAIFAWSGRHTLAVPWLGTFDLGWWYVPLGMLAIFSCTSGVNEIDGLDGLAAGVTGLAFAAYLVLAWRDGQAQLAAICAIVIGALLAFL